MDAAPFVLFACAGGVAALLLSRWRRANRARDTGRHAGATAAGIDYCPPAWVGPTLAARAPRTRLRLANLPTPMRPFDVADDLIGAVWIKRDDFTGSETSGNKIRKLEFLLAEAKRMGCDSVITVGGIQSNHCRATAAAAARVGGLQAHLVLRTAVPDADPGAVGNLMVSRLVGARLHLVSRPDYNAHPEGGWGLVKDLRRRMRAAGQRGMQWAA